MFAKQNHTQENRANSLDFLITDEINFLSSIKLNSIHISIVVIKQLKFARI